MLTNGFVIWYWKLIVIVHQTALMVMAQIYERAEDYIVLLVAMELFFFSLYVNNQPCDGRKYNILSRSSHLLQLGCLLNASFFALNIKWFQSDIDVTISSIFSAFRLMGLKLPVAIWLIYEGVEQLERIISTTQKKSKIKHSNGGVFKFIIKILDWLTELCGRTVESVTASEARVQFLPETGSIQVWPSTMQMNDLQNLSTGKGPIISKWDQDYCAYMLLEIDRLFLKTLNMVELPRFATEFVLRVICHSIHTTSYNQSSITIKEATFGNRELMIAAYEETSRRNAHFRAYQDELRNRELNKLDEFIAGLGGDVKANVDMDRGSNLSEKVEEAKTRKQYLEKITEFASKGWECDNCTVDELLSAQEDQNDVVLLPLRVLYLWFYSFRLKPPHILWCQYWEFEKRKLFTVDVDDAKIENKFKFTERALQEILDYYSQQRNIEANNEEMEKDSKFMNVNEELSQYEFLDSNMDKMFQEIDYVSSETSTYLLGSIFLHLSLSGGVVSNEQMRIANRAIKKLNPSTQLELREARLSILPAVTKKRVDYDRRIAHIKAFVDKKSDTDGSKKVDTESEESLMNFASGKFASQLMTKLKSHREEDDDEDSISL
eukprot:GHVH01003789.1.p1 GENE.GHVH01003789.1~~GHVH01003789.1.p1  ORF type:complete len:650 (-),score=96.96 GHVH01003789.1:60-1877(-)